ncbi:Uma2 family endonuclease [Thiosulfativibrio zosterae]|uniref:Putative restriction endonuclease domain-containing protein n=1 Tax=Thiosulfativibrio zosterae TaxID=2675053 RepID=A0A6F8PL87_9GAMM|nr:Uma2 family endonuclease [Thiosulfativibrio zosterae]BBP42838.1 hypothetical protein THMIRHAT_05840 [Thiosulfativibrio zosterae]
MGALQNNHPHYKLQDYELWEGRWELIEGIPYAMSPAPSIRHQSVSQRIALQLGNQLQNCQTCQALLPIDWRIAEDTVVQPDNLVVCGEVTGQYLTRAPEIIFEILSPSTASKDRNLKFELYEREGVKYYVIVDPETQVAKLYQRFADGRFVKQIDAEKQQFVFDLGECQLAFDFSLIWS